LISGF